jgi:site-specific DNA-cytosine methylase
MKKFTFIDLFAGCGGVRVSIRLAEDAKLV